MKSLRSKFPESYPDQQTTEEGQRAQQPKCCDNDNNDKDIISSCQKFRYKLCL